MTRKLISSGSPFEERIGYSRAVVDGDWVFVSGTTGFDYASMSISDSLVEQTEQCLKNIESALRQANSSLKDVIRVGYILPNGAEFEQCWPVLRKHFGELRPAATMISAGLADPRMKIEIEVTARKAAASSDPAVTGDATRGVRVEHSMDPDYAMIEYRHNFPLDPNDVARVFDSSGLRRPTQDLARIARMFAGSNLVLSAWSDARLVGVCRALTDYSYCCYLSDLAVDRDFQKQGIGMQLIERVQAAIGDEVSLILLAAPGAMAYYPRIGFARIENGFVVKRAR
jgi:enamine deaminase RidA (YjgF/YER057c/UK114 family)/GNAT superfamily N-acetyltransferase